MKTLHIPNRVDSEDSLFYSICYVIRCLKVEKNR